MDFTFSEEQTLLRNTVQAYLEDVYAFETRREAVKSETGYRAEVWGKCAELGLLALPFEEAYGGLAADASGAPVETMIIMEEWGRRLVIEPYTPSVIFAGGVLRRASEAQKKAHLPALTKGEKIWALAWGEPQARFDLTDVKTTATKKGGDYVLQGHKSAVPGAPWADNLIVSAKTEKCVCLFIVERKAKGVNVRDYPSVDGARAGEVFLDDVRVSADACIGGPEILEAAAEDSIAALCAEATGAMRALYDATLEYARTRKQFGQPIGKFQVVQHKLVDMFMACEQAVSMTYMVTLKLSGSAEERARAASLAKAFIGKAGRFVGQQAVQLHGGMGLSDELNVGHYLKRLSVIDALFGNTDYHLARYAQG